MRKIPRWLMFCEEGNHTIWVEASLVRGGVIASDIKVLIYRAFSHIYCKTTSKFSYYYVVCKHRKAHGIISVIHLLRIYGVAFMTNAWNRDAVSYTSSEYNQKRVNNEAFRRKYDALREPDWFLERIEEAFGEVNFLSSRFNPMVDKIINQEQDVPQRIFIVPPFSLAARYLEQAAIEIKERPESTIIFLISARTEAFSWHDHVFGKATLMFLKGPFRFVGLDKGLSAALVIYGDCPIECLDYLSDIGSVVLPTSVLAGV